VNIQEMSQSGNLSPQELKDYFGWPPPVVQPKKKPFVVRHFFLSLIGFSLISSCFLTNFLARFVSSNLGLGLFIVFVLPVICALVIIGSIIIASRLKNVPEAPPPSIPTDQEYEAWIRSWQNSMRQYGMQRLGLSSSDVLGKPLYVRSLVWPNSREANYYQSYNTPILIKYGADGRAHASVNRYTFFYPTQHSIAVFTGDINALDTPRFEGTRTYFYDDIVGVETSAMNLNNGVTTYAMQHFELRVSSGQSIGATTHVHDLDVDQTVRALRTLLRDKKYGTHGGGFGSIDSN
jgi:hypothetical protein